MLPVATLRRYSARFCSFKVKKNYIISLHIKRSPVLFYICYLFMHTPHPGILITCSCFLESRTKQQSSVSVIHEVFPLKLSESVGNVYVAREI